MSIELEDLVGVYEIKLKNNAHVRLYEWTLAEELWATERFGRMEDFYNDIQGVIGDDGTVVSPNNLRVVLETIYHLFDHEAKTAYPSFEYFTRQMGYGEYLDAYTKLLEIINDGVTPIKKKALEAAEEMKRRKANAKKKSTKKKSAMRAR